MAESNPAGGLGQRLLLACQNALENDEIHEHLNTRFATPLMAKVRKEVWPWITTMFVIVVVLLLMNGATLYMVYMKFQEQ